MGRLVSGGLVRIMMLLVGFSERDGAHGPKGMVVGSDPGEMRHRVRSGDGDNA